MSGAIEFAFKLLDQASGPASSISSALKHVYDKLDAIKGAGDPMGPATAGMGGAGQSAVSMGAAMGAASAGVTMLADAAKAAMSALGGLVVDVAKMTISAVDFKDNSLIAMDALLKSKGYAETAGDVFNNAVKFAGATPFDTGMIVQQYQRLLATGFKPVEIPVLLSGASDLALASGKGAAGVEQLVGAFGKLNNTGKLSGEVLQMFAEAGVGKTALTATLAKDLGQTPAVITKMLEAGKISAADGSRAIMETIRDNISGGTLGSITEKGSQTFSGLMSSLKSKALEFLSGINIDPLKNAMSSLANLLDTSSESGQRLSAALSSLIGGAFGKLGSLLNADTIAAAFDAGLSAIEAITSAFTTVWPYFKAFGGGLWDGIKSSAGPVIAIFKQLFGGISAGGGPSQTLMAIFQGLGTTLGYVITIAGVGIAIFGALAGVTQGLATAVVGLGVLVVGGLLNALGQLIGFGGGLVASVLGIGADLWSAGSSLVDGLWNGIKAGWAAMLSGFTALVDLLPEAVKNALGIHSPSLVFAELGMHTAAGFQQGIEGGAGGVQSAVQSMVDPSIAAGAGGAGGRSGAGNIFNVSVEVHGGKDAEATGNAVAEAVTVQLQRLLEQAALEAGAIGPNA